MPTVPRTLGPSVAPTVTPTIRTQPEDFGGGAAATLPDLSGVQRVAQGIFEQERAKADQMVVNEARLKAGLLKDHTRTAVLSLNGPDVLAQSDTISSQFKAGLDDIGSSLNPRQRAVFQNHAVSEMLDLDETVQAHARAESQRTDAQTYEGIQRLAAQDAVAHADDPGQVQHYIGLMRAQAEDFGRRQGIPSELVAADIAQRASGIHGDVVSLLAANGNDLAARDYLDQHKDEMVGDQRIQATKTTHEASVRAESQRQLDTIVGGDGTTLSGALDRVRGIQDADVRDATERRVRQFFSEKDADQRDRIEQNMVAAGNTLDASRGNLAKISPAVWAQFTPTQKRQLSEYAGALQGGPARLTTDWQAWTDLREMAANPKTRQAFLDLNPMSYRAKLADSQFQEIVGLREGLKQKDDTTTAKLDNLNFRNGIITETLHGIGLGTDGKAATRQREAPIIADVHRMVNEQVEQLQEHAKRPATAKEVQGIVDEIVTSHIVADPHWYNHNATTTKRTFELSPDDSLVLSVKDIKPADRTAIIQQLRARGLPVTDQAIVKAYSDYLKGLVRHAPR